MTSQQLIWATCGYAVVLITVLYFTRGETCRPSSPSFGTTTLAAPSRAQSAGAEVTSPPRSTDSGSREYHVRDLEGHPWTFGTYLPDADRGDLPTAATGS
jgi:hypothetical protein